MKQRYIVKGTMRTGNFVRVFLLREDIIQVEEKSGMLEMAMNAQKLIKEQQTKALLEAQPDVITITHEEWETYKYKVDDIVWVSLDSSTE